ncbi:MAG: MFS transporter [Burkholderiales bacterium]|nr:MFS transporter [Burkholderiales bacterium]
MNQLLVALVAMFFQQTFVALGRALPAVIAPAIIADRHFSASWIGMYFAITACAAFTVQLGCGSFIVRYGALRMSQVALVLLVIGTAISAFGTPWAFVLSAIIGGGGASFSTPASSHLLSRCTTPKYLPLVFSIKQTAVPAGLLSAGLLGPWVTETLSWQWAMLLSAAACLIFTFMLQPLRASYDDDRDPTRSFRLSDFKSTLMSVVKTRNLRALSLACLLFNGLQSVMTAYFVVYLTHLGYTLVAAGFIFSVATAVAVPGRILWGWLGSTYVSPRVMLAGLAFGMAASAVVMAFYTPDWPVLLVGLVACVLSATALSWHGVLLAETARAAPEDMRGGVTGGVLSFGQLGSLLMPLMYAATLDGTGSYGLGFVVCGLPAVITGVQLLRRNAAKP